MGGGFRFRGREIGTEQIEFLRRLTRENPSRSRRALSAMVCEAWDWRQPNGQLRDMVCRTLMLQLHRGGLIQLPPVRQRPPNNVVRAAKVGAVRVDTTALQTTLPQIKPVQICQVRRRPEEKLFEALLKQYHYLGYRRPVGEHLKHLVYACGRPIACLGWSSAPRNLGPRDRFIGWSAEARRQNVRFIAYNTRFLILPWVRVKFLASHLLGRMATVVDNDWQRFYGHRIYYLETFVDTERFAGTCYRAANWKYLGVTTGRGNNDQTHRVNRSIKAIWGYPLVADFRTRLCGVAQ